MNIDFAVTCDYALIDRFGKLSVLGIFEHIWVQEFPTIHPRMHLVIRFKGRRTEIGDHKVDIEFTDEAGTSFMTGQGMVSFAEPPAGVVDIEAGTVLIFDVPLHHAGRYTFRITVDGDLKYDVPLTVGRREDTVGTAVQELA